MVMKKLISVMVIALCLFGYIHGQTQTDFTVNNGKITWGNTLGTFSNVSR